MAEKRAWWLIFQTGVIRGWVLFVTGLALTINEAVMHGPERPSLYVLFAGMMGLPLVLPQRRNADEDEHDEPSSR